MSSRFSRAFQAWTYGLDPRQSLISVFEHVRDIPYSLSPPMSNPNTAPEEILAVKKGSCGPKQYLMAEMYRKLGFEVAYATIPFLWNDPEIRYPPDLKELAPHLPVSYHLACRVRIDDRWVLVDATWDLPLGKVGFPVNDHWDGRSDTRCAVQPLASPVRTAFCRTATNEPCRAGGSGEYRPLDGELDHRDVEDRARFYHARIGLRTPDELGRIRRFFDRFDRWLEEVRASP